MSLLELLHGPEEKDKVFFSEFFYSHIVCAGDIDPEGRSIWLTWSSPSQRFFYYFPFFQVIYSVTSFLFSLRTSASSGESQLHVMFSPLWL